jgi:hypothetical protein
MQGRPTRDVAAVLGRSVNVVNCRRYHLGLTRHVPGRPPLPVAPLADYPTLRWLAERLAAASDRGQ